jgi:MFS family permease
MVKEQLLTLANMIDPALASESLAEQKRSGTAFGVMATIRSIGALIGPFLAAAVYEANTQLLFPGVALVGAICLGVFVLLNNQAQRQAQ